MGSLRSEFIPADRRSCGPGSTSSAIAGVRQASDTETEVAVMGSTVLRKLNHLERLEAESIQILREVVAEVERPVMLHSNAKDSTALLHLAKKAFYPSRPPFPFLHTAGLNQTLELDG